MKFSLRTLLAAVAVVGIGAALWVAEPSWYLGAVELSLSVWILASTAILTAYSTGKAKTFWLGAGIECVLPVTILVASEVVSNGRSTAARFDSFLFRLSNSFHPVLVLWAFAPVVGLLCVFTHWLLIRPTDLKE